MNKKIHNCGCYYCFNKFNSEEIDCYVDDDKTALCPSCFVDSVHFSKDGTEVKQKELQELYDRFFRGD